ncbi:MAG TPA: CBS domain-containing protein [Candidatus Angelobacter sp.]|nr:CBS domain-containing protein [Candidatus Angelobacter sp.]
MFVQDSIPKGISDSRWLLMVIMLPQLDEIQKKRKALGLTQSKLAQLAGVSQSIIAKIESGTVDPSYSIAKRLVEALEKESIQVSRPRVSEIMSRPVISVSKTQLVRDAVDMMRKRGYSQLPVFDGNRCVGSISEKTILDRAARGEPLESLLNNRVRDIMDSPLPMVNDDTPLEMLLGLLQGNYGVLVTKGESTIGILTKSDILKVKQ